MNDKIQKPVDLKEKMIRQNTLEVEKKEKARRAERVEKIATRKSEMAQTNGMIDEMFSDKKVNGENSLHKIDQAQKFNDVLWLKSVAVFLIIALIIGGLIFFLSKNKKEAVVQKEKKAPAWSAVMLVTGEVYYGLVGDVDKNPIVISNVYYDYDQVNNKADASVAKEPGSLRLVKRGKENYGPDGTMTIFQPQIKYIEGLKEDSKVLKAILDHEKQ